MQLSLEQSRKLNTALEHLLIKVRTMKKEHPEIKEGTTEAPRPEGYVEDDPLRTPGNTEWVSLINPENEEFDKIIAEILATAPRPAPSEMAKLTEDNLWVWGGPTPYWCGSMAEDTLVRGADYFGAKNVVYVYGPTDEHMMEIHSKYNKMLCQINSNCRTPGAQGNFTDEENAEYPSKLSLKYPNIVGAMCDDVSVKFLKLALPDGFAERYHALKKHNSKLKMYGTIYAGECETKDLGLIEPYLDVINLWFWNKDSILDYDEHIAACQKTFPGKPILQGIFMHEYGRTNAGNMIELLKYQLDKAREYIAKGVVEGVVILGDREIKKWPEVAEALRDYLQNQ